MIAVGIEDRRHGAASPSGGWRVPAQPDPHRLAIEIQSASHAGDRGAGFGQPPELGVPSPTRRVRRPLPNLDRRRRPRSSRRSPRRLDLLTDARTTGGADRAMMMGDDRTQGDAEVTQQVEAIEDVLGLRCARACALGEDVGAVAGDDLDARVGAQPRGDAPGVPVGQEIEDGVTFEVDDHRAVAAPAPPGPLVDADDARLGLPRQRRRTHEAQEGIAAHRHRETMRHTGGGRTPEGETEMALEHAQPLGSAGVTDGDVTDALAEGPPQAGWVRAAEATEPEAQADGPALPGQIGEGALAVTVLAARGRSTGGTARRPRTGDDAHDERVGRRLDADDGQAIGQEGQETAGRSVLRKADLRRWGTSRRPAHCATRSAEEPVFNAR